jgi:hypothetical protein
MAEQKDGTAFARFIRNVENKISDLTTLEIKTIIGDYNYTPEGNIEILKTGDFKVMRSSFNLIGGDVTTYISNDLVADKYAWIRDFHAGKEERGYAIVDGNIKAIMSLFELYKQTKGLRFQEESLDETIDPNSPLVSPPTGTPTLG